MNTGIGHLINIGDPQIDWQCEKNNISDDGCGLWHARCGLCGLAKMALEPVGSQARDHPYHRQMRMKEKPRFIFSLRRGGKFKQTISFFYPSPCGEVTSSTAPFIHSLWKTENTKNAIRLRQPFHELERVSPRGGRTRAGSWLGKLEEPTDGQDRHGSWPAWLGPRLTRADGSCHPWALTHFVTFRVNRPPVLSDSRDSPFWLLWEGETQPKGILLWYSGTFFCTSAWFCIFSLLTLEP